jgi:DNA-binding transcriptional MerR regulator
MEFEQKSFLFDEPVNELPPEKNPGIKKEKKPSKKTIPKNPAGKRGRIKLTELDAQAHLVNVPSDDILFGKMYYPMNAVAEMFGVNQSLIRSWENEFDILKPKKNGKGNRLFRPEDVKNLKLIYHLLRERKYTLEGAKEYLRKHSRLDEKYEVIDELKKLRSFLNELKAGL